MSELDRVTLPNGIALDVWDSGPKDAPALIFLHGFPENHRTWRHQIAHLNDRFRCIAPDQRGYGNSSKPEGVEHYDVQSLIGDIFALARTLEIERFTIAGHDWGGAIAWGIAAFGQATGVVERAIIANAPHPAIFQRLLFEDKGQRAASQYMRTFRDSSHDAIIAEHGLAGLIKTALSWERSPDYDTEELALLGKQWSHPATSMAMLNWYRASRIAVPPMDQAFGLPQGYTDPAVPVLSIPTLVVWGTGDEALLPANLDGLEEWIEDLTIERVHDAGHFIPWEAPGAVNAAIESFLAD